MDIGHIQDDMIRELMLFIAGAEFQSTFEAFFLKHALKFTDDEEHRLEYTQLFQEFQELFEQFMQQFYLKNNITEAEFGKRCRAAVKNDAKASQYLEVVLASMDYQAFHKNGTCIRAIEYHLQFTIFANFENVAKTWWFDLLEASPLVVSTVLDAIGEHIIYVSQEHSSLKYTRLCLAGIVMDEEKDRITITQTGIATDDRFPFQDGESRSNGFQWVVFQHVTDNLTLVRWSLLNFCPVNAKGPLSLSEMARNLRCAVRPNDSKESILMKIHIAVEGAHTASHSNNWLDPMSHAARRREAARKGMAALRAARKREIKTLMAQKQRLESALEYLKAHPEEQHQGIMPFAYARSVLSKRKNAFMKAQISTHKRWFQWFRGRTIPKQLHEGYTETRLPKDASSRQSGFEWLSMKAYNMSLVANQQFASKENNVADDIQVKLHLGQDDNGICIRAIECHLQFTVDANFENVAKTWWFDLVESTPLVSSSIMERLGDHIVYVKHEHTTWMYKRLCVAGVFLDTKNDRITITQTGIALDDRFPFMEDESRTNGIVFQHVTDHLTI
ncbi:unnamed protein product, partial [Aphanomyces euteiches]